MVLGVVFSLLGIGMLVALMFNMAILALPLFVAVAAGRFAYDTGAGALGAIAVGLVAGAAALGVGQAVLILTRSTPSDLPSRLPSRRPRPSPATISCSVCRTSAAHMELWQQIFAAIGSVAIGVAALMRLATPIIPPASPTRTA